MRFNSERYSAFITLASLILACCFCSSTLAQQSTWTSFQNAGSPVMSDVEMPTEWSPEKGLAWQVDLAGYGQSTPVVFNNQVYVTSVSGEQKEKLHVQAFSIETGKEIWSHESTNSTPEENTVYVSRARTFTRLRRKWRDHFFRGAVTL